MTIKWVGASSSNFGTGRGAKPINKIVLHWMAGTLKSTDATFNDPNLGVRVHSAHYGIGQTEIHQYVKEEDTAWHCGVLAENKQSIGIEHEGGPNIPITEAVYGQSVSLVRDICKRYNIPIDKDHILPHKFFKATECPGTLDIARIIKEAAQDPTPTPTDEQRALDALRLFKTGTPALASGNLEGCINALVGAYRDLDRVNADNVTLRETLTGLEVQMTGLSTELNAYKKQQQVYSETLSCANTHPAILAEIKKLIHSEDNKNDVVSSASFKALLKKIFKGR